jgi:hypothetical protein
MTPRAPLLFVAASLVALALPAQAQELRPLTALEQAAQAYQSARWPASAPAVSAVPLKALRAQGFSVTQREVDPERSEATLTLARSEGDWVGEAPAALVRVRRFPAAASARKALLARLASVQTKLRQEEGVGDLAFAGRSAGALGLLVGTQGSVGFEVRSLDGGDAAPLAAALGRTLAAAPRAEPGAPARAPKLLGLEAGPARVGAPARLTLDFDPAAAAATHVVIRCAGGAAVLRTDQGFELYASRPGAVRLTVFAASDELESGRFEATVEVAPASD